MILTGRIREEPCRVCGGPWLQLEGDGIPILSMCISLMTPGADWFKMTREEQRERPHETPEWLQLLRKRGAGDI